MYLNYGFDIKNSSCVRYIELILDKINNEDIILLFKKEYRQIGAATFYTT